MGRYSQPATAAEIPHLPRKCQFLRNGNWLSHQAKVLIHVAKVTRQYANKVAENFVVRDHGRNVGCTLLRLSASSFEREREREIFFGANIERRDRIHDYGRLDGLSWASALSTVGPCCAYF